MRLYLLGFVAPLVAGCAAMIIGERGYFLFDIENALWLVALMVGAPLSVAIVLCAFWGRLWRPRFLGAERNRLTCLGRGAIASAMTLALIGGIQSTLGAWRYGDEWLVILASTLGVLATILPSRRAIRPGRCACGYDLAGLTKHVCPECGRGLAGVLIDGA